MAVLSVVILMAVVLTLYLIKPLKELKKNALQIVKRYSGKEMEALTGVTVAALTLYDMCKAVDKTMRIEGIRVVEKIKI